MAAASSRCFTEILAAINAPQLKSGTETNSTTTEAVTQAVHITVTE